MSLPFSKSDDLTLGVELELQLIDVYDYDLASASPDLIHYFKGKVFPGTLVPEVTESMIEISTGIHGDHKGILTQLVDMRDSLLDATERLNVGICGGGTHPFQSWTERRVFDKPRFRDVSQLYGYLTKTFTVFGQHIHVGCSSATRALYLLHSLGRYLPQFIALSASSPFVQGCDTSFNSARLNSVSAFPLSGRAPFYLDWDEFERDYFSRMKSTGIVESMKDFYWDIRPKPEYGTIELRVCDSPLSVVRAAALAFFLQAVCKKIIDEDDTPSDEQYLVYGYNRFQACRFGLDAEFIHPSSLERLTLREDVLSTIRQLERYADSPSEQDALDHLYRLAHQGSDAHFLRQEYMSTGVIESVVMESLERFRAADAI